MGLERTSDTAAQWQDQVLHHPRAIALVERDDLLRLAQRQGRVNAFLRQELRVIEGPWVARRRGSSQPPARRHSIAVGAGGRWSLLSPSPVPDPLSVRSRYRRHLRTEQRQYARRTAFPRHFRASATCRSRPIRSRCDDRCRAGLCNWEETVVWPPGDAGHRHSTSPRGRRRRSRRRPDA